jgi:hypothetical protein
MAHHLAAAPMAAEELFEEGAGPKAEASEEEPAEA